MINPLRVAGMALWLVAAAFAQSPYPDPVLGTRAGAFSAQAVGLGHCALTYGYGPASLLQNPATLTAQTHRWRYDLAADISRVREVRKYPIYDAFDGVLNYNNYAINDHLFSKLDGGLSVQIPGSGLQSLVLSAASYSVYRFDYRYHEEVRDRFASGGIQDRRLGLNKLDITGDLRSISIGAAAKSSLPVAVGFGLSALGGDWAYTKGVYYATPDSANLVNRVEYSPDGTPVEGILGALWEVNERVTLGGRMLVPLGDFKFEQTGTFQHGDTMRRGSGTITTTYPKRFALGVEYRPQNEFRPILLLEGEIHTYHDFDPSYDNTLELRSGIEQQVVPGAPVRLGFVYWTSPRDKDQASSLFTAGIGFRLQRLGGDFGVELGKVNYMADDLFPQSLYGDTDRTDRDRVETALFRGIITLRFEL